MVKVKTNVRVAGKSYTRETLKAALEAEPHKGILAGYNARWYDSSSYWNGRTRTSTAPVLLTTLKKLNGRSKWKKALLVDAIVAVTFGDPLPEDARQLTKEEAAAKRKADAEAKEAARVAKAKEAAKFKPPKGPLKDIGEEAARYLSKMVMAHPGGCDSGKKEFIARLGLPTPPAIATVTVTVKVPVDQIDVTTTSYGDRSLTKDAQARLQQQLKEAAPEGADLSFGRPSVRS